MSNQKTDHLEHILDNWDEAKQGSRPKVGFCSRTQPSVMDSSPPPPVP
jgi:hypothetical protein